jgi:hypothetical protein
MERKICPKGHGVMIKIEEGFYCKLCSLIIPEVKLNKTKIKHDGSREKRKAS